MMTATFGEFMSHIERVKQQYSAVKNIKDKLPHGHLLIQMAVSENYTGNTLEEIQSVYWNNCLISLHPVVIYFRGEENELKHTSYVHV
ncbi:hypothetical protein DPMN_077443 [Dreissena polymorpha]|uniref:Uncharacterized protein n=1 Tax=Dreissena polymorpha TaxID=45954 RepID=A0A9D3YLY0_DREPO|nr:hypothetical protein DPMN_077443 [Dreissena polymorpha]